jgi:hypothetical protein
MPQSKLSVASPAMSATRRTSDPPAEIKPPSLRRCVALLSPISKRSQSGRRRDTAHLPGWRRRYPRPFRCCFASSSTNSGLSASIPPLYRAGARLHRGTPIGRLRKCVSRRVSVIGDGRRSPWFATNMATAVRLATPAVGQSSCSACLRPCTTKCSGHPRWAVWIFITSIPKAAAGSSESP